jgi:hypothetical protein
MLDFEASEIEERGDDYNKDFWQELIAYFPLARNGPYRKTMRLLLLFVYSLPREHVYLAATQKPSRCLAKIHIQTHIFQSDLKSLLCFFFQNRESRLEMKNQCFVV